MYPYKLLKHFSRAIFRKFASAILFSPCEGKNRSTLEIPTIKNQEWLERKENKSTIKLSSEECFAKGHADFMLPGCLPKNRNCNKIFLK